MPYVNALYACLICMPHVDSCKIMQVNGEHRIGVYAREAIPEVYMCLYVSICVYAREAIPEVYMYVSFMYALYVLRMHALYVCLKCVP